MKNSNDTIGNQTRDLPASSTLPQPNAPPRTPSDLQGTHKYRITQQKCLIENVTMV
jgi:hypothetical protein